MFSKFWEKLSEGLAETWLTQLLLPPTLFLGVGLVAWIIQNGFDRFSTLVIHLSSKQGITLAVAGLAFVAISNWLVNGISLPVLRLLEDYWPWFFAILSRSLSNPIERIIEKKRSRREELANNFEILSRSQYDEYIALDAELGSYPKKKKHIMPTQLGNVLRGAEEYSYVRYGLEIRLTWPRLWLALPETEQKEIIEARKGIDDSTHFLIWGVLLSFWAAIDLRFIVLSLVFAWIGYRRMVEAALLYGELLRSAYDNHRFDLYQVLRWKKPGTTDEEESIGLLLTDYLKRGELETPMPFEKK